MAWGKMLSIAVKIVLESIFFFKEVHYTFFIYISWILYCKANGGAFTAIFF